MSEYNNPVPIKCWEKFLKSHNCTFKKNNGSHHIWSCPNSIRPIVFWGHKKEVPRFHVKNNLRDLGLDNSYFTDWAKKNC